MKVRIEGLKELDAALGQLPKATALNVLRRVGRARLEPMADDARRRAPRDQLDLVESITVTTKAPKSRQRHRKESTVEVYMGPGRHPQATLQEFGTSRHPPQPFMRPAWDAGKGQLLEGLKDDLAAEIDKAAKRVAKKRAKATGA